MTLASTPTRQAADASDFEAAKAARAARFGIPIKPTVKPEDKPKGGKGGKGGKGDMAGEGASCRPLSVGGSCHFEYSLAGSVLTQGSFSLDGAGLLVLNNGSVVSRSCNAKGGAEPDCKCEKRLQVRKTGERGEQTGNKRETRKKAFEFGLL